MGEAYLITAISVHHVEFIVAVAAGHEDDLFSIRRPTETPIIVTMSWTVSQTGLVTAIRAREVDLVVAITVAGLFVNLVW